MNEIIRVDGTRVAVTPKNGTDFELKELQDIVGGYIEIVHLSDGRIMVVNEEGTLIGLQVNVEASKLFGSYIVGDVLVCESRLIK